MKTATRVSAAAACFALLGVADGKKTTSHAPKCINPEGDVVDYWYAIKHPNGMAYSYLDASTNGKWVEGEVEIDHDDSAVARTNAQFYNSAFNSVVWNGQPPSGASVSSRHAHAKGAISYAQEGSDIEGIWLTHSWPHFPAGLGRKNGAKSAFSKASDRYGQSFSCVAVDEDNLKSLSQVLSVTYPNVFYYKINLKIAAVQQWATTKKPLNGVPDHQVVEMESLGGRKMVVIGKSSTWGDDMFEDLVAPYFQKDFYTETWQNGQGKMDAYCKKDGHKYNIENIATVSVNGDSWKESNDHSKWGISTDFSVYCVGDINRQTGQRNRGGAFQCVQDKKLGQAIKGSIKTIDSACKDDKASTSEGSKPEAESSVIV